MMRLGSTSYVYETDLINNLEHLSAEIADMELVLFETADGQTNFPNVPTIEKMKAIASASGISFTVHLPRDIHADDLLLQQAKRVIDLTAPLCPYAYIFHLDGTNIHQPTWTSDAIEAIKILMQWVEQPALLCLENLESYPLAYYEPIWSALPIGRTLDIGHLWKQGSDALKWIDLWLPYSRVIHLHGMGQSDHQSLAVTSPDTLDSVVAKLKDFTGVLTLEVFGEADFFSSRQVFFDSWKRVHGT